MNGLPQNPAMNGRSGRADANRPADGRTEVLAPMAFSHTVRFASARPDLPFMAGTSGYGGVYAVFSTGKAAAK